MAESCPKFHHTETRLPDECVCVLVESHASVGHRHQCAHGYMWEDEDIRLRAAASRKRSRRNNDISIIEHLVSVSFPNASAAERRAFAERMVAEGFERP